MKISYFFLAMINICSFRRCKIFSRSKELLEKRSPRLSILGVKLLALHGSSTISQQLVPITKHTITAMLLNFILICWWTTVWWTSTDMLIRIRIVVKRGAWWRFILNSRRRKSSFQNIINCVFNWVRDLKISNEQIQCVVRKHFLNMPRHIA